MCTQKQFIAQALRQMLGTAYVNDALLTKVATAVQTHGQLVVWGDIGITWRFVPISTIALARR